MGAGIVFRQVTPGASRSVIESGLALPTAIATTKWVGAGSWLVSSISTDRPAPPARIADSALKVGKLWRPAVHTDSATAAASMAPAAVSDVPHKIPRPAFRPHSPPPACTARIAWFAWLAPPG